MDTMEGGHIGGRGVLPSASGRNGVKYVIKGLAGHAQGHFRERIAYNHFSGVKQTGGSNTFMTSRAVDGPDSIRRTTDTDRAAGAFENPIKKEPVLLQARAKGSFFQNYSFRRPPPIFGRPKGVGVIHSPALLTAGSLFPLKSGRGEHWGCDACRCAVA